MVSVFFLTDILHTLFDIPRDLNFIEHTSDIGWKKYVVYLLSIPFSLFSFRNVCGVRLDKDGREGRDKGGGIGRPLCLTTRMEA